jgi:competence protein ComEA
VREASNPEDVVRSRLRSVLAATEPASEPVPSSSPPGWPTGSLAWSDLIPSWPDDVDLDEGTVVGSPGAESGVVDPPPVENGYAWQLEDGAVRPDSPGSSQDSEVVRQVGSGAFQLGAFDPGRRGVKALAAVAVLVVLVAGFLAWRARPQVDPVPTVSFSAVPAVGGIKASAAGEVVVAVAGKVRKPGLVRLPVGSRVADALQAAGGAQPGVDVAVLNLARKVVDGELIMVGASAPPVPVAATGAAGGVPAGPVNLNTATLADLDTLPGVGPVLAQRIMDARTAQGGFTAVSDLRKVDGIGDSRYEQLKDLVTV